MNKKNSLALVIIWAIVIFMFSSQNGDASGDLSSGISESLYKLVLIFIPNLTFYEFHSFIREMGHFSIYFIFSILLFNHIRFYNINRIKQYILSIVMSVIYAFTDEFHQAFVPERYPDILDIYVDTIGAIVGVCTAIVIMKVYKKIKR